MVLWMLGRRRHDVQMAAVARGSARERKGFELRSCPFDRRGGPEAPDTVIKPLVAIDE